MSDDNRPCQQSQAPLTALERQYAEAYEREAREQFGHHWISPNVLKSRSDDDDFWTEEQKEAQWQHELVVGRLTIQANTDEHLASVIDQLGEERRAKAVADAKQARKRAEDEQLAREAEAERARIESDRRDEEEQQAREARAAKRKADLQRAEDEWIAKAAAERWIPIPKMVEIVLNRHPGMSIGRAQRLVSEAIASGEVRRPERHPDYGSEDDFIYWLDWQQLDKQKAGKPASRPFHYRPGEAAVAKEFRRLAKGGMKKTDAARKLAEKLTTGTEKQRIARIRKFPC
jgi:hypothetical protein